VSSPKSGTVVTGYIVLHSKTVSAAFSSFILAFARRNGRNGEGGAFENMHGTRG